MRILVVDDEENIRLLYWHWLTEAGHAVELAEDGNIGLKMYLDRGPYNLVFTGLCQPGLNGFQLAERIRLENPTQAILIATACQLRDAVWEGSIKFPMLFEPCDLNDLLEAVNDAVQTPPAPSSRVIQ